MFEMYVNGVASEKFYSLAKAIERASHICVACSDVEVTDIISLETGEVLFAFLNGEIKIVSPSIEYKV